MGYIVSDLLATMRARLLTPTIIEFTSADKLQELLPSLQEFLSISQLKMFTTPSAIRETRSLQDRVLSRFQNPLLSFKVLKGFNMVAMPLASRDIEDVATWPSVVKVYRDKLQWAFSIPLFSMVPAEEQYTSPTGNPFTTTMYSRNLMGVEAAYTKGLTGSRITACTIDTGGSMIHEHTREMEYYTAMRDKGQVKDKNGHGQHVMSTIGGRRWFDRSLNVEVEGVAPGVHQIGIKALGFVVGIGFQSDIIEALDFALTRKVDVVNMSLGSEGTPDAPEEDAEIVAINKLVDAGILVCVAAGNSGPDPGTITTPGCAPSCLTVGSYSPLTGELSEFSSRGPVQWGDGTTEVKPDVVAPGEQIYTGCLGLLDPLGDGLENHHAILSGTSMATPHITGLLALAKEYFRSLGAELTVDLIKTICGTYGSAAKSNDHGWGALHWSWFEDYATTI